MNKLLLTTLGLVAALSAAYAQGTFSASNAFIPEGQTQRAFVLGLDENPIAKANGRVVIINQANGEILSPGGAEGAAFGADGLFFVNDLAVPGVANGGTVNIWVQAWDSTTGSTWDTALVRGVADVTVGPLGGGPTPAATFRDNSNFTGIQLELIPEPSTIALAALGVVGLFFVARRKN